MDQGSDIRINVDKIVSSLGGDTAVARGLNLKSPTNVLQWRRLKSIPAKYHQGLLDLAVEKRVLMDRQDFCAFDINHPAFRI